MRIRNADFDEIVDLIAEAARVSRHAKRAYELLRENDRDLPILTDRQALIAGRMAEVA